jgi:CRP-like cAMP-binding protein
MLEDPIQKIKIIRDIIKTVHLKIYEEGAVIYGKGESSTSIYMVIKGAVSLCVAVPKEYKEGEAPK